jgi:hypothetical protein
MSTKSRKPRSPATPSRSLEDCLEDVKKIYGDWSHGTFTKSEIASSLGVSAGTGPFNARLFSLKEFGLLDQDGDQYKVSSGFMTLSSTAPDDARFKQTALAAIRHSKTFKELLDEAGNKLPSPSALAHRLETQKRFNADRAKSTAAVLGKSLRFAGVLDSSNNILPVRGTSGNGSGVGEKERELEDQESRNGRHRDAHEHHDEPLGPDTLSVEIPVGDDRKVAIRYPHDLSSAEAKKVGNVLSAIVG